MALLSFFLALGAFTYEATKSYTQTNRAKRNVAAGEEYLRMAGYNVDRQYELIRMPRSELEGLLGRKINPKVVDSYTDAIKEQLSREGFKYLVRSDVIRQDPMYRQIAGIKDRPGFVTKEEFIKKHFGDKPITPAKIQFTKQDKVMIGSVISTIVIILMIILCFYLRPPIPDARIGMSYYRWHINHSWDYKENVVSSKSKSKFTIYTVYNEELFGIKTNVSYLFNERNTLECIQFCTSCNYIEQFDKRFGYPDAVNNGFAFYKHGYNYDVYKHFSNFYNQRYSDEIGKVYCIQRRGNRGTEYDYMELMYG